MKRAVTRPIWSHECPSKERPIGSTQRMKQRSHILRYQRLCLPVKGWNSFLLAYGRPPVVPGMVDAGSNAVFLSGLTGGAAPAPAPTLLGYPLFFSDRLPALGAKGDICLCDLSYYLLLNGSGPRIDLSTELLFTSDKSIFRIIAMLDGRPWLTEPILLEGSAGSTVSPFVVLAA
jgi:hypothetical protein